MRNKISLIKTRKKLNKNIAGFGLVTALIGATVFSAVAVGATKWIVSMQQATISNEDRMTAMSLAYNKWQEYAARSYDSINSEARKNTTNNKFDITSDVGGEHNLDGGGISKPVTITVYKAGTTNVAYAMVAEKVKGVLTFEDEIDRLEEEINSLSDRLTNAINNINNKDAQQDAEIAALKAQIANIQSQIDSLKLRVSNDESNTASRIAELQNLLNELNAKLTELSSQGGDGKWAQLYWIDHTENYYRTLQLATK